MQFYFIRHAQSENNAIWDKNHSNEGRKSDPELTPIGKKQAQALADYLAQANIPPEEHYKDPLNRRGYGFTHLYSSLMIRAIETATPIARALDLPLLGWTEIHERGGIYDAHPETKEKITGNGNGRTYLATRYPHVQLPENLDDSGWWQSKPYETTTVALGRARNVWAVLMEKHAGTNDRVAIVSHGGFFNSMVEVLLNSGDTPAHIVTNKTWLRLNNVSISRFEIYDDFSVVGYMNRVDFLPTDLIT
jgi:2,3-bisphosphoglycerate-dependent phosphoglycerate mutase